MVCWSRLGGSPNPAFSVLFVSSVVCFQERRQRSNHRELRGLREGLDFNGVYWSRVGGSGITEAASHGGRGSDRLRTRRQRSQGGRGSDRRGSPGGSPYRCGSDSVGCTWINRLGGLLTGRHPVSVWFSGNELNDGRKAGMETAFDDVALRFAK